MDAQEVLKERTWREGLYRGTDSPLSPEAKTAFRGLRWFPLDARFCVEGVRLARPKEALPAELGATGPDAVSFLDAGVLEFELLGVPCRLRAFEPAPGEADEPYLLIPFRDLTSGKETYGAGRYLDLEPATPDVYTLDFNRSYHPYCAHDDGWTCTLPPPENSLRVSVEAGERL